MIAMRGTEITEILVFQALYLMYSVVLSLSRIDERQGGSV